ncbi:MAG: glycosyltransferase family 2 protein [Pseudonocardiaceae bacterium]
MPSADAPMFSILCTAYQTEAYLAETIESVLAQTRRDWELVVVDNGRSAEIAGIVRHYLHDPRIRLVRQENRGIVGGVMAAAGVATGRYFVVLDSDDAITPDFCARMGAILQAGPGIDALGCDAVCFADPGGHELPHSYLRSMGIKRPPRLEHRLTVADIIRGEQPYYTGAFRREAWEAVGGYQTDSPKAEDLSILLRLAVAGFDIRAIPDRLGRYRIRADSTSRHPSSVESFEESVERALTAAAAASGRPEDLDALRTRRQQVRYLQALRRARWAFRHNDLAQARQEVRLAFGQRPTLRTRALLVALAVAPGLLRHVHPVKQRLTGHANRIAGRIARVTRRAA